MSADVVRRNSYFGTSIAATAAIQTEVCPVALRQSVKSYLQAHYDLSRSEQEIFEQFVIGNKLEKIARDRNRSYCTVRAQFYSALKKCSLTSQVDLVREVVTGAMLHLFHTDQSRYGTPPTSETA